MRHIIFFCVFVGVFVSVFVSAAGAQDVVVLTENFASYNYEENVNR